MNRVSLIFFWCIRQEKLFFWVNCYARIYFLGRWFVPQPEHPYPNLLGAQFSLCSLNFLVQGSANITLHLLLYFDQKIHAQNASKYGVLNLCGSWSFLLAKIISTWIELKKLLHERLFGGTPNIPTLVS